MLISGEIKNIQVVSRYLEKDRPYKQYNYDGFSNIGDFTNELKETIGCNPQTGVISIIHLLSLDIKKLDCRWV